MLVRILVTLVVLVLWLAVLAGNAVQAGRTAAELQIHKGVSPGQAHSRAAIQTVAWIALATGVAIFVLVRIW